MVERCLNVINPFSVFDFEKDDLLFLQVMSLVAPYLWQLFILEVSIIAPNLDQL